MAARHVYSRELSKRISRRKNKTKHNVKMDLNAQQSQLVRQTMLKHSTTRTVNNKKHPRTPGPNI